MDAIRGRLAWVAAMAALAAALTLPLGVALAAAPNALDGPIVSPTHGDTTITFSFTVHYVGRYPATGVTVAVGLRTVTLSRASGTSTDGTYAGSSRLPAGTWTVTFNAVASKGNSPSVGGGTVSVAGPTPSPRATTAPTPAPAVKPVSKSTPAPVFGRGSVSQTSPPPATRPAANSTPPAAALAGSATNPPRDGGTDRTGGGTEITPDGFWPIMLGGFGLIALFVAYYVFAMDRDRRRRALAETTAAAAAETLAAASAYSTEPQRAPAVWELDARLEDAPVGTVEFLPLEDGTAIGSPPTELAEPAKPRRGNPRLARISEARKHRTIEDRHTLLRRT